MARSETAKNTVVFRGPPRRLRLLGPLPEIQNPSVEPDDKLKQVLSARRPFRSRTDHGGRLSRLVARFDRTTPPGEYHARITSTDGELPVLIQVEPYPRLGISPSNLNLSGKKGSKPTAHVLFVNKGNVPFEIPDAVTVSMCNDTGLDDAVTSTLLVDSNELDHLFSHFVDKIRATHGGLLPLVFTQGSGMLSPGQQVSATIKAEFSPRMVAGQSYHGILKLHTATQIVSVTVTT